MTVKSLQRFFAVLNDGVIELSRCHHSKNMGVEEMDVDLPFSSALLRSNWLSVGAPVSDSLSSRGACQAVGAGDKLSSGLTPIDNNLLRLAV